MAHHRRYGRRVTPKRPAFWTPESPTFYRLERQVFVNHDTGAFCTSQTMHTDDGRLPQISGTIGGYLRRGASTGFPPDSLPR